MKLRISRHASKLATAATLAASAAALLGTGLSARAAAQSGKPGVPDISIRVETFKDMGGAEYKGPDSSPLTERLVSAMKYAIADAAKKDFRVADPTDPNVVAKNATAFVVESEVTAIEVGADPDHRPYMLVSRLYREGKARKLVAQFAGNARTLRDLTGNLGNQSGASNAGLIGGIGKEIVDAAENARPLADALDEMIRASTATHRVTVDVMADANGKQEPRQGVLTGQRYRLRVNSQDAGRVYLITMDTATKHVSTPYAQTEPLDAGPGSPVTLPPNDPFIAPKTPGTLEYIVFVRKGHGAAASLAEPRAPYAAVPARKPIQVASLRENGLLTAPLVSRALVGFEEGGPAIELLSSPTLKGPGSLEPGIANLLSEYQSDPDGTWIATRVKVTVTRSSEGSGDTGSAAPGSAAPGSAAPGSAAPGSAAPR